MKVIRRGDVVTAAPQGDFGKPRPCVVIQNNELGMQSVVLLPFTSTILEAERVRITVRPTLSNGLTIISQVMTDKPVTMLRSKVGDVIGKLDAVTMRQVTQALAFVVGIEQ